MEMNIEAQNRAIRAKRTAWAQAERALLALIRSSRSLRDLEAITDIPTGLFSERDEWLREQITDGLHALAPLHRKLFPNADRKSLET